MQNGGRHPVFIMGMLRSGTTLLEQVLDRHPQITGRGELNFLAQLAKENPETILKAAIIKGLNTNSIRIIAAERNEIPPLLLTSHASIFFIRPGFAKKASSPTKLGESLAIGIPIICNSGVGDSDYFMLNNNCGWIVNSFDETNYRKVVNGIQKDVIPNKEEIRKVGEKYFSLQHAIETYEGVYKQLLS